MNRPLGCIYIRARVKATSLPICCIVFNLCVYTTVTAAATRIKRKNHFHFDFCSNINAALGFIYTRAKVKAIFFFYLCRYSVNTPIGNNATGWKRHRFRFRFRSNINESLHPLRSFQATHTWRVPRVSLSAQTKRDVSRTDGCVMGRTIARTIVTNKIATVIPQLSIKFMWTLYWFRENRPAEIGRACEWFKEESVVSRFRELIELNVR